jgi:hypothetical protein
LSTIYPTNAAGEPKGGDRRQANASPLLANVYAPDE